MAGWTAVVMLVVMVGLVTGLDREITVHVEAGKEECFFETVKVGNTLTVEYQVIDGGASQLAELDINFRLVSPRGTPILAEFKKSDGVHSHKAEELGDYKICFDNQFSYMSSKTVYFEIINENEDEDYDDLAGIFDEDEYAPDAEYYDVQVSDIEVKLKKIKEDIVKARHLQDQIRLTDLKDRSIAEHNFERVNFMSMFYMAVLILAGLAQVVLVRSLFDEKSKINPLWKKAFKD